MPVVVKDLTDEEIIKMGLIENLQEDLNPLDEAKGIQRLQKEFNITQEDLFPWENRGRPFLILLGFCS